MSIIAWIILGLVTGVVASRLIPESRTQGPALSAITGMAGGVLGGDTAAMLISRPLAAGFLSPVTWPAAVAGAAALLLARWFLTRRRTESDRAAVTVPVRRPGPPQ
jgi:uncharacterized membrane protein YeaQ/YmgE (transglycosylase-associated protein family)